MIMIMIIVATRSRRISPTRHLRRLLHRPLLMARQWWFIRRRLLLHGPTTTGMPVTRSAVLMSFLSLFLRECLQYQVVRVRWTRRGRAPAAIPLSILCLNILVSYSYFHHKIIFIRFLNIHFVTIINSMEDHGTDPWLDIWSSLKIFVGYFFRFWWIPSLKPGRIKKSEIHSPKDISFGDLHEVRLSLGGKIGTA